MVLKELRLLHLDPKAARKRLSFHTGHRMSMETSKPFVSVTHFLQQDHAYSYKDTS